jgi:hypothetical protein
MSLRMTPKRFEERRDAVTQKLTQNMHDLFHHATTQRTISSRIYPNLNRTQSDQPNLNPVQGWSHLQRKEK